MILDPLIVNRVIEKVDKLYREEKLEMDYRSFISISLAYAAARVAGLNKQEAKRELVKMLDYAMAASFEGKPGIDPREPT